MRARLVKNYYGGKIPQALSPAKKRVLEGGNRTTVSEFARLHYESRRQAGIKRWDDEQRLFRIHIEPVIGDRDPTTLTTWDLKQLLLKAKSTPVKRHTKKPILPANETLKKIRGELLRLFKEMMVAEIIEKNPADPVMLPIIKGAGKKLPAAQLSDEEFVAYVEYPDTLEYSDVENEKRVKRGEQPLICRELKMLAIISRTIGGCRTSDLHALDWSRIDTENWTTIVVQRQKVERTDTYEIPEVVVPFLKSWWADHEKPTKGPVFPVRGWRGLERGGPDNRHLKAAKEHASYATRFRRDLLTAGITRTALHQGDDRHSPTTFHAIRGAFATGLGAANVDPRTSMRLTSHTSWAVHLRYLAQHSKPMAIPSEALPKFGGCQRLRPGASQS